jgi:DNA replication protein DnaC
MWWTRSGTRGTNRRLQRLLKAARLRYPAGFEEIDFALNRNLEKNQLLRLSDCRWIEEHQDIIVSGPCGTGKSFLACALGTQACLYGYRVGYYAASKLFGQLKLSRADGSYLKELSRIQKQALFILDDFGLQGLDAPSRLSLLEILEDRYGRASSIVVSQLPVSAWHETIGEPNTTECHTTRSVGTRYDHRPCQSALRAVLFCS